MKIYCENCKYISFTGWFCNYKKRTILEENYLHKKEVVYRERAENRNSNNNCPYFISKNIFKKVLNKLGLYKWIN